jgi:2,5-diketo-D-gluconate reductase A
MTTATIPGVGLNDGRTIPQVGFGVFQIPPADTADMVRAALAAGYRHIDTAQMYRNERGVGDGIRASGLDRGDVFVTSKLSNAAHRSDDARRAFDATLRELGSDYVDLFLVHWPLPTLFGGDFVTTWRTLEAFQQEGRARSIGVSNFQVEHLERLAAETATVPAVNQIEAHPYFPNDAVRDYGRQRGIVTEAWAPLVQGQALSDPVIRGIAARLGRSSSQVILRWHIQRGDVVFPKTTSPTRMRENLDIFDFDLGSEDLDAIAALQQGDAGRTGPHPDTFDWLPS